MTFCNMTLLRFTFTVVATCLSCSLAVPPRFAVADDLEQPASWQIVTAEQARAQVTAWLAESNVDQAVRERVEALWDEPLGDGGRQLHRQVMSSLAIVDASAAALLQECEQATSLADLPEHAWLQPPTRSDFVSNNSRLYLGKWYAIHQMYNEALEMLDGMETNEVIDPASLLFLPRCSPLSTAAERAGRRRVGAVTGEPRSAAKAIFDGGRTDVGRPADT